MLTARQRKIIRSMLPKGAVVGDVSSTIRTFDSFGTWSFVVPSKEHFTNQYFSSENGGTFSARVPLRRRVYVDRIGAFEFGRFGVREYYMKF